MSNNVRIVLVVCACIAVAAAQYEHYVDFSDGYLGTSFGAPSLNMFSQAAARDPRANTGPVVFPASPPGDPSQTSGVVVGASGFGFVPPGSQGPVVFPASPPGDPSQTSGVVVGASGFGFVPPGSQGPALPRFFYQGFYIRR